MTRSRFQAGRSWPDYRAAHDETEFSVWDSGPPRLIAAVFPILALLTTTLLILSPASARAQEGEFSADGWFGLTSPKGDLGDVNDSGWATGLGGAYRILDRVSLRLDGALERTIQGPRCEEGISVFKNLCGPNSYIWHATAGVDLEVTEPGSFAEIAVSGGAGFTHINIKAFREFSEIVDRAPTITGSIFAGVEPTEWLTLFTRIRYYVMLEEGEFDLEKAPLGREATLINSLGVRLSF